MPSFVDRTGHRIDSATVEKLHEWRTHGARRKPYWLFRCDCGGTFVAVFSAAISGTTRCNLCRPHARANDLIGRRFGLLTVTGFAGRSSRSTMWHADCSKCCSTVKIERRNLNRIIGCPCRSTHGMSRSPTYTAWRNMINRTTLDAHASSHRYKDRAIVVCDRWRQFENFYSDMGAKPSGKWLDRIDNNGPYSPENCRWATPREQHRNRSNIYMITFRGKTMCLKDWAHEVGISYASLRWRVVRQRWDIETALTTPVRHLVHKPHFVRCQPPQKTR